ncbi:UNVERIFIED_CONTAM: hypothetical protein Sradi_0175100 [Sesamum radiatum]|uniref:Endonuclease/exonuclease/phosphatase domain-containing protein n=1 Tax=Sesamum radiatum TaxID=300843 RepID=A0AAW2W2Y4_SESRA
MNLLSWNCQGIGGPWTVRKIEEYLRKYQISIIFLSETKYSSRVFQFLKNKLDIFGVDVPSVGRSGGLMLLWRKDLTVQLKSYSANHIDADIYLGQGVDRWRLTGYYGEPYANRRKESWNKLIRLSRDSTTPWICLGDYNEILSHQEKLEMLDQIGRCRPSVSVI